MRNDCQERGRLFFLLQKAVPFLAGKEEVKTGADENHRKSDAEKDQQGMNFLRHRPKNQHNRAYPDPDGGKADNLGDIDHP